MQISRLKEAFAFPRFPSLQYFTTLLVAVISGCATAPQHQSNTLTSYEGLTSDEGRTRKAKYKVPHTQDLQMISTVYVAPTAISPLAIKKVKKDADGALVANAISRSICIGVSDRFKVVETRAEADMIVHATITNITPTNVAAAGVSTITSIGTSAVLPVGVPRLPIGLGGLAVEGEATSVEGKQLAALIWSKGANSLTNSARVSQIGDAYSLANSFGKDFSKMLVTGGAPFKGLPKLPSAQKLKAGLGGKYKYEACEKFGRAPGLKDMAASQIGLPPSWTDKHIISTNH